MAPTDEELLELMPQGFRDDLALVSRMAAHGAGPEVQPGLFRVSLNTGALGYARAVWDRARAVLAQPEHEAGPTDWRVDVLSKAGLAMSDVKAYAARTWPHAPGEINDSEWQEGLVDLLIGALDELGLSRPAPAPAGEVAELVAALRIESSRCTCTLLTTDDLRRAADLLEREAATVPLLPEAAQVIEPTKHTILVPAPVPVAVSERPWEREGWCNEKGECWGNWLRTWKVCNPRILDPKSSVLLLPFNSLPLPNGKVES